MMSGRQLIIRTKKRFFPGKIPAGFRMNRWGFTDFLFKDEFVMKGKFLVIKMNAPASSMR
jgi:hypothetical protein